MKSTINKGPFIFLICVKLQLFCFPASMLGQLVSTSHPHPTGYTSDQVRHKNAMEMDPNDDLWMGFRDIGLGKYDGTTWVIFDSLNNGLPSNNILSLDITATGAIWAGTAYGATSYNGTSWLTFNTINSGLPSNKVTAVSAGSSMVWFGTDAGIAGYDGSIWTSFNTGNSGLINDTVTYILVTPGGTLWVGTLRGLSKFDNNTWTSYDINNSILPSNSVFDLEYDNSGNLWVSSLGIFVINGAGQVLNFQTDIYLGELPIAPMSKVDFAKDASGRIYFRGILFSTYHIFRFGSSGFDSFVLPTFNQGIMSLGHMLVIDANLQLWYNSKRESNSFLTSFDMNSYQAPPGNYSLSLDNYKHLEINEVKTLMLNRGDMHWNLNDPKYEVPKGSGKHSVYTSALWIGGMDAGGNVHLAAQTYRQSGVDYWPGPVSGISIPFDSASCNHYDKIWKISKWEVEAFKTNFANGNVTNGSYAVPYFFLSWPAKGNNFVTDDKAPFVDYNNDNIYNPYDGDYPLIKGDQMLFWIFNDSLAIHSVTSGPKLGIEVHASAYAYSCPGAADSNFVLNRTTLYNYRIINRSPDDYTGMYIGLWCDMDLGNAVDDYVGCDTTLAAAFTYNGDNDDENTSGYGLNPPMQNVVVLKGALADPGDGIDNDLDGIIDETGERTTMNHFHNYNGVNNAPTGDPNGYIDFYNYLQSIWLDGIHVTYGGDGRNPSTPPTNFMFSGVPYDTGWTEFNSGNTPEDRRFLLSSGPVSLLSGGELNIDFAYVYSRDSINPNGLTTSVAKNIADIQRVRSWFDNDNFPSCVQYVTGSNSELFDSSISFEIQPNPVDDMFSVTHNFAQTDKLIYTIIDVSGRTIKSGLLTDSKINCSYLSPGIYLLKISNNHFDVTTRFLKLNTSGN